MTTRKDLYLKKLNDNTVNTPPPVTNEEKILADLAGSNGLGVELPAVTSGDNGKTLVVENGAWALGNTSDNNDVMFVTFSESKENGTGESIITADKTINEVYEWVSSGKRAIGILKHLYNGSLSWYTILPIVNWSDMGATIVRFCSVEEYGDASTKIRHDIINFNQYSITWNAVLLTGEDART